MKWFGEPWPSAKHRAPVCEDDADRADPPPPFEACIFCGEEFEDGDQGVVLPHIEPSKTMDSLWVTELRYGHIACLVRNILPEP